MGSRALPSLSFCRAISSSIDLDPAPDASPLANAAVASASIIEATSRMVSVFFMLFPPNDVE